MFVCVFCEWDVHACVTWKCMFVEGGCVLMEVQVDGVGLWGGRDVHVCLCVFV